MSEYPSPLPVSEPNQNAPGPSIPERGKATSVAKLIANRRNAKKSTGPRTPRGKEYSSRNALKHGLFARPPLEHALLGEDPAEYAELQTKLFAHYRPVGRAEELEVERIADLWWRLRRAKRYETAMVRAAVRDFGRREIERQKEHCYSLELSEENLIIQLRQVEKEITTTGRVPADIDQKLASLRLVLETLWSQIERKAREEFQDR